MNDTNITRVTLLLALGVMVVLDIVEIVIHVVYGWGCWGLQPGGRYNAVLVLCFALVFVITAISAMASVRNRRQFLIRLGAVCVGIAAIAIAYLTVGWRVFTSIHNQGPENILLVAALNVGIVTVFLASTLTRKRVDPEEQLPKGPSATTREK